MDPYSQVLVQFLFSVEITIVLASDQQQMSSLQASVFYDIVCFCKPVPRNQFRGFDFRRPCSLWAGTTDRVVVPGRLKRSANTGSILGCDKGTRIKRRPSFFAVVEIGCTSIPILASLCRASSWHSEIRKTKTELRKIAIFAELTRKWPTEIFMEGKRSPTCLPHVGGGWL